MISPKVFPTILMILDLCAAVVWLSHGDWRKCCYWVSAFVLTLTITY